MVRLFNIYLMRYDEYCECNESLVAHKRVQTDQFEEIIRAFLKHPQWKKGQTGIEIVEMDEGEDENEIQARAW